MRISPRATYRLQLHPGFTFADAAQAVPYLAALGISHLYLSPIAEATEGSVHGYDVVDHDRIRAALGGDAGLAALADVARAHGLAILLDIVPNHMSIASRANRWWWDVLEDGRASAFARYFDVDWSGDDDRVLLPILAERYGRAVASGAIAIVHSGGGRVVVRAGDRELPLSPRALGVIVRRAGERAGSAELAFVGDALAALSDDRARRRRDKAVLSARLAALAADPACRRAIDAEIGAASRDPAELDALLEQQAYRLAHWSVAKSQLPYRRFFDIASLVAIRDEDPDVWDAVHAKVLALHDAGVIDGLRVDHVDGLRDPEAYLRRLRARAPDAWIVVEKITTADEALPASWPVDGTTGYDFAEKVGGLFVDPDGEGALTRVFEAATGYTWAPIEERRRARLEVLSDALHSELARLAALAARACATSPSCRDYTHDEIEAAIAAILAEYPVYRTYLVGPDPASIDRARIAAAVAGAADAHPDLDRDLFAFLDAALAFEIPGEAARELALSAQQVTGGVIAKGDEDTLAYRQVRLLARCEVGAEPSVFAHAPAAVHRALAAGRPRGLAATSTHDSKRGEDVRARIAVISEMFERFAAGVTRWRMRADRHWDVEPDRVLEYVLWQTLVGAWPLPLERARRYAEKAAREARLRTSWRAPDVMYEAALSRWLDGVYSDTELVADIARLAAELAPHGDRNALAQLVVKLCAPGVADFYQGCELHDDSLVDPDNRRSVDFAGRGERLRWVADASPRLVLDTGDLGYAKLWTIRRVLAVRRKRPAVWEGAYRPIASIGAHAERVFAFARGDELVAVVPRLVAKLGASRDMRPASSTAEGRCGSIDWGGTRLPLPPGAWRDVLGDRDLIGGSRDVAELLATFPVAVLVRT